jgi:hypothetical protein
MGMQRSGVTGTWRSGLVVRRVKETMRLQLMCCTLSNFSSSQFTRGRCEFDLLFYNSQSQANWSRKNGQALPAVRGEISNTEI